MEADEERPACGVGDSRAVIGRDTSVVISGEDDQGSPQGLDGEAYAAGQIQCEVFLGDGTCAPDAEVVASMPRIDYEDWRRLVQPNLVATTLREWLLT